MKLHDLKSAKGSIKNGKRIGRGEGSGKGGTSTRGHKGAKSRSGFKRKRGFEGGQTPLYMRIPKRGFNPINRVEYTALNIGRIQEIADEYDITEITPAVLQEHGWMKKGERYKILAGGAIETAVTISAHAASKSAVQAIEDAGGSINIV